VISLNKVILPDFGRAGVRPEIKSGTYLARMEKTLGKIRESGIDVIAIFADREHSANMSYLSGFDPRFEEALLLISKEGRKKLLVGNECMGYLPSEELGIEIELFQDFSLMGQTRNASRTLREILADFGITAKTKVGCAGWKTQSASMIGLKSEAIEIPAYIVDLLRDLSGTKENITNVNDIFMNNTDGLRIINEPEQIAFFEYAATVTSDGMLNFLKNLRAGVRENELSAFLNPRGLPLSCHTMTSFGEKARRGLSSPSDNVAKLGTQFSAAFGVWGSLTARAGFIAKSADDIPSEIRGVYEKYVFNYFSIIAAWYNVIKVGANAGEVFAVAEKARNPELIRFALNPGHFIHLDEWTNSPFSPENGTILQSGMAIQVDIIPRSTGLWCKSNMEDGIVLADENLRKTLAVEYPEMWRRIEARRQFMKDKIGIKLDESVLPLSNIPAWLPPFGLNTETVLVNS
jgi:Xaa-Pro aminopeptidase